MQLFFALVGICYNEELKIIFALFSSHEICMIVIREKIHTRILILMGKNNILESIGKIYLHKLTIKKICNQTSHLENITNTGEITNLGENSSTLLPFDFF